MGFFFFAFFLDSSITKYHFGKIFYANFREKGERTVVRPGFYTAKLNFDDKREFSIRNAKNYVKSILVKAWAKPLKYLKLLFHPIFFSSIFLTVEFFHFPKKNFILIHNLLLIQKSSLLSYYLFFSLQYLSS